ncbi:MAG: efflux RND transporter periplasmic adaptor subunit [Selenomonadaceae bacterium]
MRKKWSKADRKRVMLAGSIGCLVILGLFYFLQHPRTSQVNKNKGLPLVQTYTVARADMMRHISLFGQTVANAKVAIAPKYTGKITAVNVQLGDHVKAGDVLLVQDTLDVELAIRQNNAALSQAQADAVETESTYNASYLQAETDYRLKKDKYERNQYLLAMGAISQDAFDTVEQEYAASKSALESLQNQVTGDTAATVASKQAAAAKTAYGTQGLEKQLADLILRAPRDGVIGYRAAEIGAIAPAGTKVLEIVDNTHLYVDCQLAEADAAVLKTGMNVRVDIDAAGKSVPGKIIYVSPAMEDASKSYTVRLELEEATALRAGMFARTSIDILQRPQTLFVPKEAIINKNGRNSVFVIAADDTAVEREVRIGLSNDELVEILEGIDDGDIVAVSNQDKIKAGTAIDRAAVGAGS